MEALGRIIIRGQSGGVLVWKCELMPETRRRLTFAPYLSGVNRTFVFPDCIYLFLRHYTGIFK